MFTLSTEAPTNATQPNLHASRSSSVHATRKFLRFGKQAVLLLKCCLLTFCLLLAINKAPHEAIMLCCRLKLHFFFDPFGMSPSGKSRNAVMPSCASNPAIFTQKPFQSRQAQSRACITQFFVGCTCVCECACRALFSYWQQYGHTNITLDLSIAGFYFEICLIIKTDHIAPFFFSLFDFLHD